MVLSSWLEKPYWLKGRKFSGLQNKTECKHGKGLIYLMANISANKITNNEFLELL